MSISITRYVDVTSGVGGTPLVPTRELVARIFTGNDLLPPSNFIAFDSSSAVGDYFGTDSEEYQRAVFYFSWVSKNLTQPNSIQFARWVDVAVAPRIYSLANNGTVLANWTAIDSGSFILTMGTHTFTLSSLDFSAAGSLTAVATILQTAVQAQTGGGALWTAATVTYNTNGQGFNLVGGATGDAEVSVAVAGSGTNITGAGLLGWLPQAVNTNGSITPGAIWANGSDVEPIATALSDSNELSNNFGSFTFLTNLDLTIDEVVAAATWNYELNNLYLYSVAVTPGNAGTWQSQLSEIGGVALTLSPVVDPIEFPEMCPMMIEAATNYDALNSVQNYMFQIFPNLTPSVTTDSDANAYDALGINYYGQTQEAGIQIQFYQRGTLQGPVTSPLGMNTYVNEIWLKDAAVAAIANLLLIQARVPANTQGRNMILNTLQSVVEQGLDNGTISVNKTLTNAQQMFITGVTGDEYAWHQVQNAGYWLNCIIVMVSSNEYEAQYTLVYSKDDVINFVQGTHVLV